MKKTRILVLLALVALLFSCAPEVTVTFSANGGKGTMDDVVAKKGATIHLPGNGFFSRTDYVFVGWNLNPNGSGSTYAVGSDFTVTGDVSLYAEWVQIFHTVTFNANGGTGNDYTQEIGQSSSASLVANRFTKVDCLFAGWSLTANGSVDYGDEADYTMGTSDVILYAIWAHTVTFDGNGGSGSMAVQMIGEGLTEALTANGFTKTDYLFIGWSTSATGTAKYGDGADYKMGSSDVTLYAVWDKWLSYGTSPSPSFKMRYVPVPAGGITFPSKKEDAGEPMTVTKPFFAAKTEVTWKLWDAVSQWNTTNSKGYDFGSGQMGSHSSSCGVNHPVTRVNWREAIIFCNALTQWVNETQSPATPLMPVYYSDAAYTSPIKVTDAGAIDKPYIMAATNGNTAMSNCSVTGFRLPTSAEWECVARWQGKTNLNDNFVNPLPSGCTAGYYWTKGNSASGSTTSVYGTDGDRDNVAVCWYNSGEKTAAVKSKRANGLGLYDVSGNVWEWSFDWDPDDSSSRVLRGGDWYSDVGNIWVGYVNSSNLSGYDNGYGLRVFSNQ